MEMPFASIEVFCSYAEKDAAFLEQLEGHLSVLRHAGRIMTWHKRKVIAGSDWEHELDHHLNTASLILLLISSDFLASDYQYGVELQRAIQRHDANEAHVIPIVVRPCDWKGAPFEKLQVVPRNGIPITLQCNLDEAFAEVAKEIRMALEEVQQLTFAAPPTALPKIWQIPYQRNPVFTGREDLLQTLTDLLQMEHSAVLSQPRTQAISGLGGIGKTQLAVEYAYRAAPKYQAVFWVTAETQETLISGYAGLAMALNLLEKDEPDQRVIINAVQCWLQTHTDWLLILDNADDLTLLVSFLPLTYGGRVVLTTRAQATGRFAHRLEIPTLTNENGGLLILRRAGLLAEQGSATEASGELLTQACHLSADLGDLPLALDQAGAYIEETGCSLLGYQQQYQQHQAVLLARRGQLATDHPDSVTITWSLSFEKVEQASPMAAQVLRLCAFLAPDAIPEELVVRALVSGTFSTMQAPDEIGSSSALTAEQEKQCESIRYTEKMWEMDEVGTILRAYSLIQRNPQEATLGVHRLVQAVLRETMPEEERHTWAQRTVLVVKEALPVITFESWKRCEQYVPHAQMCVQLAAGMIAAEEAHVLHWIGAYLLERQRIQEAGRYAQQALTLREQHLGREHLATAASLDRVARWWELCGKYAQAEPLYVRALAIREQQLGTEHLNTTPSLNNLAVLYMNKGRYAQAEPLLARALAICEQQLGAEHPDTALSLNNLAALYEQQGKHTQAEPLYVRALAIREQQLGAEHPETALSLNNLAILYEHQGKHTQAELLLTRALVINEQQLGAEHLDTAFNLNNLAVIYKNQGKYAQAELLYQRALAIRKQQLEAEHPDTQTVRENYALLLQTMERARKRKGWKRVLSLFRW